MDLQSIAMLDAWLDENTGILYKEQPLAQDWVRIVAVLDHMSSVAEALAGFSRQNPRLIGQVSQSDILNSLADAANMAILAIQHFTKDANMSAGIVSESFDHLMRRAGLRG